MCSAHSQVVSLLRRGHVGPKHPFFLRAVLLYSAEHDLIRFHLEAGTEFFGVDVLVVVTLSVQMMSKADEVIFISKRHNSLAVDFWLREQILHHIADAATKRRVKPVPM